MKAEPSSRLLSETLHSEICRLCSDGDDLASKRQFEKAFGCYRDALKLIPEPIEQWEATTWVLAAIGDLYFLDGEFEKSATTFEDAVRCPGGLGNPFIHLRIGECQLELGRQDRAADELTRAYMGAGTEIFASENPKYMEFLRTRIKPPVGQNEL